MSFDSDRRRGGISAMLIAAVALVAAGCAGGAARTREPLVTPSAQLAGTLPAPSAATVAATTTGEPGAPTATSVPPATSAAASPLPGPTPIVDAGLPAPALDSLVTADGPFDLAGLEGAPTLVFFGYTHCPDVCPATVGELVELTTRRPDIHVVFVTVDPERDTPEFMGEWTAFLPKEFVGVTGSPTAIRHAADGYGVRYARVDSPSAAGYSMSHTAFVYLVDAEGRLRLHFPFGTGWESMLQTLDTVAPTDQELPS